MKTIRVSPRGGHEARVSMPKRWSRLLNDDWIKRGCLVPRELRVWRSEGEWLVELARATFILQPLTPLLRSSSVPPRVPKLYPSLLVPASPILFLLHVVTPRMRIIYSLFHYVIGFSLHPERYRAANLSTKLAAADSTKNYFSNRRNFLHGFMNELLWMEPDWKGWKTSFPDITRSLSIHGRINIEIRLKITILFNFSEFSCKFWERRKHKCKIKVIK